MAQAPAAVTGRRSEVRAPAAERLRLVRTVSIACALAVVVIAVMVLAGWAFGVDRLKSVSAGTVTVKPNAALSFALSGLSLAALSTGRKWRRAAAIVGVLMAGVVAVIALMTIAEYVVGSLGIDQLLFHDSARAVATIAPGRMSIGTALALVVCSAALTLRVPGPTVSQQQLAASVVLVIGSGTVLEYLYGIAISHQEGTTATAPVSAVMMLLIGAGLLLARAEAGFVAALLGDEPGGVMARWLLATVGLLLPVLGAFRLFAQQAGLYSPAAGVGIMVVVSLVALGAVVALATHSVNVLGRDRTLALHRLSESERRLRRTLEHLLQVRDEERRELAMDLHDDTLPALAALSFQLEVARGRSTDSDVRDRLQRAERELREAAFRLRHLTFDLLPEALASDGLAAALRHRLDRMRALEGLEYDLHDRSGHAIPAEPAMILYRIALEALRNVARHAQASHVRVELERVDGVARITISDDGVGFAPTPDGSRHLGLRMMTDRAELAGGRFEIGWSRDGGTRALAEVPVDVSRDVGFDLA